MDSEQWKGIIVQACKESKTYHPAFNSMISTLADIMALRDQAMQELVESGEPSVIVKTSDRGAQNPAQNPRLQVIMDLSKTALPYWKELLLRPQAKSIKIKNGKTLEDVLEEFDTKGG